jgi:streptomycin 3"-adenylyltransferase
MRGIAVSQQSTTGGFLNNVPDATRALLADIVDNFRSVLTTNLIGIYLHGSLAMGCFNPAASDIDFIVVVNEPLGVDEKRQIVALSLDLADRAYPNGLEFSLVLLAAAQKFTYPTPFELHYSPAWDERYRSGEVDLGSQNYDKDLAAHFTIIRYRGICLHGASREETFSDVPASDYLDSIVEDTVWSYQNIMNGPDGGECSVPMYGVLNICRVVAFIEQGAITSKLDGGQWGMEHLPQAYHPIIHAAIQEYTTTGAAEAVDCGLLKQFATYAMAKINDSIR